MEYLVAAYIFGNITSFGWAISDWIKNSQYNNEENIFKILKYITWGRLIFSVIFLPGVIAFYIGSFIIWTVVKICDLFESRNPFDFLKNPVFKNK